MNRCKSQPRVLPNAPEHFAGHVNYRSSTTLSCPTSSYSNPSSNGIPKTRLPLQHLLPPIRPRILPPKVPRIDTNQHRNQPITSHARPNTRLIIRLILGTENQTPSNPTQSSKPNQRRARESTLPLPTDIIRLIRHASRDRTTGSTADKECAEESRADGLRVADQRAAGETHCRVDQQHGAADVVFVADPGEEGEEDGSEDVLGSGQHLGLVDGEAHVFAEEGGEEVGEGVAGGCEGAGGRWSVWLMRLMGDEGGLTRI